jgi:hypothetical protein
MGVLHVHTLGADPCNGCTNLLGPRPHLNPQQVSRVRRVPRTKAPTSEPSRVNHSLTAKPAAVVVWEGVPLI